MGDRDHREACNTSLQLGLGLGGYAPRKDVAVKTIRERDDKPPPVVCLDLSFALFPKEEKITSLISSGHPMPNGPSFMKRKIIEEYEEQQRYPTDRRSGDLNPESKIINTENGARKKLRLTKEQTRLLENSFKRHSTLNPTQKQALAGQLNLKPRQVEVWFQNRRARTKLKQTEVDCEFLKKLCENLDNENRKLNEELQELKSVSMLTMCSSCGKIIEADHDQHDDPYSEAAANN